MSESGFAVMEYAENESASLPFHYNNEALSLCPISCDYTERVENDGPDALREQLSMVCENQPTFAQYSRRREMVDRMKKVCQTRLDDGGGGGERNNGERNDGERNDDDVDGKQLRCCSFTCPSRWLQCDTHVMIKSILTVKSIVGNVTVSVRMSLRPSVCFSVRIFVHASVYPSIYMSIHRL